MKKLWELLAEEISTQTERHFSPQHCENRWRVLNRNYKKYIDNKNKTGSGRRYFEFAEEMGELFGNKTNIYPELLLSSDTPAKSFIQRSQTEDRPAVNNQDDSECAISTEGLMVSNTITSTPAIPTTSTITNDRKLSRALKRHCGNGLTRNSGLEGIKKDRDEYQKAKLKLLEKKFR
ncbi:myb/sant-like dna-binding domain [Holotrichia oblita]|uniref:Myb/sant-like dna-binding domain n=2 Tax=Holotrichia oblita TaxID=644536 RepID=A0ACB9SNI4_HOLOL|nr:myb/sant-like dna-binding domain [Holotrichia oblita]KAI4456760.1 myb/sant-like dna-binding domain [Holotrichia oblita]